MFDHDFNINALFYRICSVLQGELMNNIEKNVCSAQDYVLKAKEETKAAVKMKKTNRTVRNSTAQPIHSTLLFPFSAAFYLPLEMIDKSMWSTQWITFGRQFQA